MKRQQDTPDGSLLLPPGTVVHVCGWPVELAGEALVMAAEANLELVRRDLYLKPYVPLLDPQ